MVKQKEGIGELNNAYLLLLGIEPILNSNADFLEIKSRLCYALWKLDEAEQASLALVKMRPSNLGYGRLGNVYKAKKNMPSAEKAYLTAIDMVPNRFIERYRLYQLYKEIGDPKKAKKIKEDMLQLPVKIPSEMIENIKTNINSKQ